MCVREYYSSNLVLSTIDQITSLGLYVAIQRIEPVRTRRRHRFVGTNSTAVAAGAEARGGEQGSDTPQWFAPLNKSRQVLTLVFS
jgi:hypothetical protein